MARIGHGHFRTSQPQRPSAWRRQRPVGPAIDPSGYLRFGIPIAGPHSRSSHSSSTARGWTRTADPRAGGDAGAAVGAGPIAALAAGPDTPLAAGPDTAL